MRARSTLTIDRELQGALERLGGSRAPAHRPEGLGRHRRRRPGDRRHPRLGRLGRLLDADSSGYVDMTEAVRSPGSTLKPLIYGLAFELGLAHPQA